MSVMTKILLISNKSDLTIDFVVLRLTELGISFYRFNTEELGHTVSVNLDFENDTFYLHDSVLHITIDLIEIASVYYRRPEIPKFADDTLTQGENNFLKSEFLYLLEGIYKILQKAYWISPLYSIREAENKVYQLKLAKEIGFRVPPSLITNIPEQADAFYSKQKRNCIVKPIKTGLIEDTLQPKVIFTSKLENFDQNLLRVQSCSTFFQKCINKIGDVRVTIVGETIFAALIHSQEETESITDWRRSERPLNYSKIDIPDDLTTKCLRLLKSLNLRFGAIDFILDENTDYLFLEINPNGQWAWIEKQLGYDISGTISKLLIDEIF